MEDSQKRLSILFLEDDVLFANALVDMLEEEGYLVRHVTNGSDALYLFNEFHFDIVLSDIFIGEPKPNASESGIIFISRVHQKRLRTKEPVGIVALTGKGKPEWKDAYLDSAAGVGADVLLAKPVDRDTIISAIEQAAGKARERWPKEARNA